ncbi:MAG: heme exporter protein CcmD [Hyphomicrobium sp.]|nr:heme exporter protein CcmD [Hyphomicrobium sp.]
MNLGTHAAFILISYGATALVIAALIGWLIADGRRQLAALADLEARGVRRRSSTPSSAPPQPENR